MLVVVDNQYSSHWTLGSPVTPLSYKGEIVIAIDPSKTNMALLIGTGEDLSLIDFHKEMRPRSIIKTLEFSGNERKRGPAMDTSIYCEEIRQFLYQYLKGARIKFVGVEQAITQKGEKVNHVTNMVLTEIRSNILNFFLEAFRIKVVEINNWAWKHAILPEGYRGQQQKGSKLYFCRNLPQSPFSHYFEDDMTDCICVYLYIVLKFCKSQSIFCTTAEPRLVEYKYTYVPMSVDTSKRYTEFTFNPRFSLEENMNYYANRVHQNFVMQLDWDIPTLEDIYTKSTCCSWDDILQEKVKVIVCLSL